jgi:hypothetical protein
MNFSPTRKALLVGLPLGMLIGIAGTVLAADPRLDDASAAIDKAIGLLEAADNPGVKKHEFGGHRAKAIDHLKSAKREIGKAKDYADKHPAPKDGGKEPPPKDGGKEPPIKDGGKEPPTKDGGKLPPTK